MTLRSRPVLDRKHRPRWQDELRTQQLTVIGFAVAIAVALGIFGAAAWNGYWEAHFRPVAAVGATTFDRADLEQRTKILTAETISRVSELQAQLTGSARDQVIQQQIDQISLNFNSIDTTAAQSLVDQQVLAAKADELGISVTDDDVDAALAQRYALPERVRARLILVESLPDDAQPDDEPTDEQKAAAQEEAQAALDRVEGGEDFAAVATDVSDDFTASIGGELGWFEAEDSAYGEYFTALADADVGDLVGPIETDRGYAVLELVDRRDATADGGLRQVLSDQGVDEATYREYVRGEALLQAYRDYFAKSVATSPAAQQRVAQIRIAPVSGSVVPQERARHILIQPLPDAQDQSEATEQEWDAALEKAREVEAQLKEDGADWWAIAEESSNDPGSATRGGDLGWYDPTDPPFVEPFNVELANLDVGDISDPIRTDFGWHVIQKTAERESPTAQAAELVDQLRADPDSFGDVARDVSEDYQTANEGGELGWVARYQLGAAQEDAIFGLSDVDEISDPVDAGSSGIYIYQLLESSDSREIEPERLDQIRTSGFQRWLQEEVRSGADVWIDPQYATSSATG
jgi:parvulin-like peptidyl-prolyl isomerase